MLSTATLEAVGHGRSTVLDFYPPSPYWSKVGGGLVISRREARVQAERLAGHQR
jgi:hypothetical protein